MRGRYKNWLSLRALAGLALAAYLIYGLVTL
jgi:hypothetical protein